MALDVLPSISRRLGIFDPTVRRRVNPQCLTLDFMTINDYNIVMIPVNIAMLKAKLSFYLGQVKQGGEILVMDRNTPVATIIASGGARSLVLTEAKKNPASLKRMKVRPAKRKTDSGALLREGRDRG